MEQEVLEKTGLKVFLLEDHHEKCKAYHSETITDQDYCEPFYGHARNEFFLFQYEFRFYLVVSCVCQRKCHHLDFKEQILNKITKLKKRKHKDYIDRGKELKKAISSRDNFNIFLKKPIDEVCYIYSDSTGKEYCFTNTTDYLNVFSKTLHEYRNNYREAVKDIDLMQIDEIDKEFLKEQAKEIFYSNTSFSTMDMSDLQVIKLTDMLTKTDIKKLLNTQ